MPTYNFKNKETGEITEEMMSISDMEKKLEEGEVEMHHAQVAGIISQSGSTIAKTSGDWKDHLERIKKSSGSVNTIHN